MNDFEIGKILGKGSFGMVCLVKRKKDRKIYAMKQVKIQQLNEKAKQNTLNEIRILASLSHKNIIGYKDAFFDENSKTLNIVMEYADDGDMLTKIKHNLRNNLLYKECVIWFFLVQILEGLSYLHENKIIHRDLKNANIFLTKEGIVKIGDLNVSKITKKNEMATTQTGTPYYVAPEIWRNKPYEYKCDIWSLGCILYELCKLKPPFRGTNIKELRENIKRGIYEPIQNVYSNDLKKIISLMLKQNPNERPSAKELLNGEIVQKKIKEYKLGNKFDDGNNEGFNGLIETIKIPKNLEEINRNLPNNKYNNEQRIEEMILEDEYETSRKKNGFLNEQEKNEIDKEFGNLENKGMNKFNNNNINNNKFNNGFNNKPINENFKVNNNLNNRKMNKNINNGKNNIIYSDNISNYNNNNNLINNKINQYPNPKNISNSNIAKNNQVRNSYNYDNNKINNNINLQNNNNFNLKNNINNNKNNQKYSNNNMIYNNYYNKELNNNNLLNNNNNVQILKQNNYYQNNNLNNLLNNNVNDKNNNYMDIINSKNKVYDQNIQQENYFGVENNYKNKKNASNNNIMNKITPKFKSINTDDINKIPNGYQQNNNIVITPSNRNINNNNYNLKKRSKTPNKLYINKFNNDNQNIHRINNDKKRIHNNNNSNKIVRKSKGKKIIKNNNNNNQIQRRSKPMLLNENKKIKQNKIENKKGDSPFNIKAINYEGNQNYYDLLNNGENNNNSNNEYLNNKNNDNYIVNNSRRKNEIRPKSSINTKKRNINNQNDIINNHFNNYNKNKINNNNLLVEKNNNNQLIRNSNIIQRGNVQNFNLNYYNEINGGIQNRDLNPNYHGLRNSENVKYNYNIKPKRNNGNVVIERLNYQPKRKLTHVNNSLNSNKQKNAPIKRARSLNKNIGRINH